MSIDDRFIQMFFEEARELLHSLEEGLMELERKQEDRAHLDKTFRAAHSIKGAAAMVGLAGIAEFTNGIETVLDRIRSGRLAIDAYVISTLLEANDHLAAAVEAEAAGSPIPAPPDITGRLVGLVQDGPRSPAPAAPAPVATPPTTESVEPAPALAEPPASEAALPPPQPKAKRKRASKPRAAKAKAKSPAADEEPQPAFETPSTPPDVPSVDGSQEPGGNQYRIHLEPGPDVLRRGLNPLGILDELRELGTAHVIGDLSLVPPLEDLEPERCYVFWTIELQTDAGPDRLDDVFLFLADDSRITIEQRGSDGHFRALDRAGGPEAEPSEPVESPPARAAEPRTKPETPVEPAQAPQPAIAGKIGPAGRVAGPAAAATHRPHRIRVDAGQLDDLVGLAGELAVLSDNLQGLAADEAAAPWAGTLEALDRVSRLIRDTTLELRMVPVEELFSRFPRVVRDLAERSGKEIDLRIVGQDTRLDRTIIERLSEPMIHLIRNAVDHGIEPPEERLAAGKPRVGRITLAAGHEGDRVALRIEEDGRGLDREKIVRKGISAGLVPIGTSPDDPRVDALIFEPGFSTRDQVGDLSGRGVGLDVVRDAVRSLRGSLAVESAPGQGTAFIFRLPLTLALIDGLLVETGGSRYVVPLAQVEECVSLNGTSPALARGRPCVSVRGELVPMVPLRKLFRSNGASPPRQELLLTRHSGQRVGVVVDRLLGRVQAVIQGLGEGLHGLNRFSGATILADGSVSLILDLAALVAESRAADNQSTSARMQAENSS